MSESFLPIDNGTRVITTALDKEFEGEWVDEVIQSKKWGVGGVIVSSYHATRHVYKVEHDDHSVSAYISTEFEIV